MELSGSVIARTDLSVRDISIVEAQSFIIRYQVQKSPLAGNYLAVYEGDEIVAVLGFDILENSQLSLVASASKICSSLTLPILLREIEEAYQPDEVIVTSDHCVNEAWLYKQNGFSVGEEFEPDYHYFVGGKRRTKVEVEQSGMPTGSLHRIWDAGKTRWVKVLKEGNTTPSGSVTP